MGRDAMVGRAAAHAGPCSMGPRLLALTLVTGLLVGCGAQAPNIGPALEWQASSDGTPLACRNATVTLGRIRPRRDRLVEFRAINTGKAPLELVGLVSNCGCLRAKFASESDSIPSGEDLVVDVTLSVTGYRKGPFQQKVHLILRRDGEVWDEYLRVDGDSAPEFEVHGERLDFGTVRAGQAARAEVELRGWGCDWDVTGVSWTAERSSLDAPAYEVERMPGNDTVLLVLTYPVVRSNGLHERSVLITTSHPDMPRFHMPSQVRVEGGVNVVPPRLPLGRCRIGMPGRWQQVTIEGAREASIEEITLRGVENPAAVLELMIEGNPTDGFRLKARFTGEDSTAGNVAGTVVIRTDSSGNTVAVPISATVLSRAGR